MTSPALAVFLLSLLAFPMTYITNSAQAVHGEVGLFVTGVVCLSLVCYLTYLALAATEDGKGRKRDWLFYVFTLGTFASVVDLIIGLEADGFIRGFMSVYLRNGEPYLGTPYGRLITYWDGTVHYAMYLFMLASLTYKWNYRQVALYWTGSIGHSMLILIPGAVLGKDGVRWSFLLNVPYIFIPLISGARFFKEGENARKEKERSLTSSQRVSSDWRTIWRRPVDFSLILLLITATGICLLRGFAVLGCRHKIATSYLNFYEPYLKDPVAFPKVQMLIYLFYFVPFFLLSIYALLHRGIAWLPDWVVLFAGASAQAQIPHILASQHSETPRDFQVPRHESAWIVFWLVNLFLLILPHLLALRCFVFPHRFSIQSPSAETKQSTTSSDVRRKSD